MQRWISSIRNWLFGTSATSCSTSEEPSFEDVAIDTQVRVLCQLGASFPPLEDQSVSDLPKKVSPAERQIQGARFAANHLALVKATFTAPEAAMYAQGVACVARDVLFEVLGPRLAYEQLSIIADAALDEALPKDSPQSSK